jgi:anti-sigma factor RsiW
MTCAETLRTQAFIDGEALGAEADAAERHIATCAECQAVVADAAALSDRMRSVAVRHRAPAALRERILLALDKEAARADETHAAPPRLHRPSFWFGLFGGAGVSGLIAATALLLILPPAASSLLDQITDAHTNALMAGRQIAVVSTDHHTVKPWFAGRIAVSPPVSDFAAQGYKLTGGRLDHVAGAPAAVVVYEHGKHEIDLFVWADRGAALPASGLRHGYHTIFWKRGDLDFAAVSDTAAPELEAFAQLVRAEPE